MIPRRVGLLLEGETEAILMAHALSADERGVDVVWIGHRGNDPHDARHPVVAAAVLAQTDYLRVGVVAGRVKDPLRLAEDLAVLDVMSAGRAEMWITEPSDSDSQWRLRVERMLSLWDGVTTTSGRCLPLTPSPVQPEVPVVVDSKSHLWFGGTVRRAIWADQSAHYGDQRVSLVIDPAMLLAAATQGAEHVVTLLHRWRNTPGLVEVALIGGGSKEQSHTTLDVHDLLRPLLTCAAHEVGDLLKDSWPQWAPLTARASLVTPTPRSPGSSG